MLNNDQLFWAFVLYDLIKSIAFLVGGVVWGFKYGLARSDQMMAAALKVEGKK
jgi:hypothetical protein